MGLLREGFGEKKHVEEGGKKVERAS